MMNNKDYTERLKEILTGRVKHSLYSGNAAALAYAISRLKTLDRLEEYLTNVKNEGVMRSMTATNRAAVAKEALKILSEVEE
jgi:hypothetical protein